MTNTDNLLRSERRDGVLTLTMNRPAARNALNAAMLDQLAAAFTQAQEDASVRSVVLAAEGPVFCAGGDLKEIFASPTPLGIKAFLDYRIRPVLSAMAQLRKPIVAALAGPVAGAGIGIALSADILVAGRGASFVLAFGKVGAMPDSGVIYLMNRSIGVTQTKNIVLRNLSLSAEEAVKVGLYTELVDDDKVLEQSWKIAHDMANGPTVALGMAKAAIHESAHQSMMAYLEMESLSMGIINTTADQKEGVGAFLAKRDPVFRGC